MKRYIMITEDGKVEIMGRWKVGEIVNAAQMLTNIANGVEFEMTPIEQPAPQPTPATPRPA